MLGVGVQPGPAAAQRVATRRRVILVVVAVGRAVAAAVVPGRHGHRNAERRRVGQGPVNGAAGLCRPGIFRTSQLMLTTVGVAAACAASLIAGRSRPYPPGTGRAARPALAYRRMGPRPAWTTGNADLAGGRLSSPSTAGTIPSSPGRHHEAALTVAVLHPSRAGPAGAGDAAQRRAERPGQLRRGAGRLDPAGAGQRAGDLQAVTAGDFTYPVNLFAAAWCIYAPFLGWAMKNS